MTADGQSMHQIASGLASAALHFSSVGNPSALVLAREAITLQADTETLTAYCQAALAAYDVEALEEAVAMAEAYAGSRVSLLSLIADLKAGPLAAIALARRLSQRRTLKIVPSKGRILYVLHKSLPYASDGYAMRSHGIAKGLLANGADLVCMTRPGFPDDLRGDDDPPAHNNASETVDGVEYHRLSSPMRSEHLPQPSDYMTYATAEYLECASERIAEEIRRYRPACVLAASNLTTALPACLAAHGMGLPFIYEVRGFWEITRTSRQPDFLRSVAGRQEQFLETAIATAAKAVITLTQPMRDELVARGVDPDRISLAPNACDPAEFRPVLRNPALAQRLGIGPATIVIGYIGSLNDYEGLDILVSACAALRREGLACCLLVVGGEPPNTRGDKPTTRQIREVAAQTGGSDWLIMPGRVPHDEVADWYSLIDIAPFPRKSLPVTELVSPVKPLEAMAMGKAVVVSDVGGMREMVEDGQTGLVVPSDDEKALGAALRRLMQDEALRRRLGAEGRSWVQNHRSWRHSAACMMQKIYEEALRPA